MIATTIPKSMKGASQPPSRYKGASKSIQLPLFHAVAIQAKTEPDLIIEPVPLDTALGADRYYITVHQGSLNWRFPIQWGRVEAEWFLLRLKWINWSLDEDTGYPVQTELIYTSVETLFEERNESLGSSP